MYLFQKKIIYYFLLVLLILFCINKYQSVYNTDPQHYRLKYNRIIDAKNPVTSMIIGSSHSVHAFHPNFLNNDFYNLAYNGGNSEFYYYWYNDIFLKFQASPKVCIIGIDWFMFDRHWLWRRFSHDTEYLPFKTFVSILIHSKGINRKDGIINRFPFLKYRKTIIPSLKGQMGDSIFPVSSYRKGYISYELPYDSSHFAIAPAVYVENEQVELFKKLVNQMLASGTKVIFVMTPEYGIMAKEYLKMPSLQIIDAFAKEQHLPFLNFNTDYRSYLNESQSYFTDWGHMNEQGSIAFTKLLNKELSGLNLKR